ncbi:unnamed protein product [Bursaphelenchus okinawaensis]|uniref:Uncharacterized protein n=1 Tax=Bursaphelenchus okinawaensis TaxID=465554 RepID=A0A811LSG3_9BILA|nr:unnamed protein product [Bursaphelenchus okinawaensis]CAG9127433.1 unnamed protein product [Bursaphelenchus okinawaensis]
MQKKYRRKQRGTNKKSYQGLENPFFAKTGGEVPPNRDAEMKNKVAVVVVGAVVKKEAQDTKRERKRNEKRRFKNKRDAGRSLPPRKQLSAN